MIIVKTKKHYPGLIIGGFGLLGGALNAMMIPGQPIWMLALIWRCTSLLDGQLPMWCSS